MKKIRARIPSGSILRVVGDGAIAGPAFEGKMVPVLILDTRNMPLVEEAIRMSEFAQPGDVRVAWIAWKYVPLALSLELIQPVPVSFVVPLAPERYAMLIEAMLKSGAVYIQGGKPGDRIKRDIDKKRLAVGIPPSEFGASWPALYKREMTRALMKRGLSRREAGQVAAKSRETFSDWAGFQLPNSGKPVDNV